jgi:hypothetical protein
MKIKILSLLLIAITSGAAASQVTNCVNITPNLIFYLQGFGTNNGPQSEFGSDEVIYRMLTGTGTNLVFYRFFPAEEVYDFHLFDSAGEEVEKSKAGLANSVVARPPASKSEIDHFKPGFANDTSGLFLRLFRPDDMFVITNSGIYEMELRMRLCVPMTNGLPDVALMGNSQKFFPATNLGVLTSPPLRVKVLKK